MKRKEYTSCLVKYTKDESPTRGFNPPKQYVKGKVIQRQVESFWARCEPTANESSDEERTEFTCGILVTYIFIQI